MTLLFYLKTNILIATYKLQPKHLVFFNTTFLYLICKDISFSYEKKTIFFIFKPILVYFKCHEFYVIPCCFIYGRPYWDGIVTLKRQCIIE